MPRVRAQMEDPEALLRALRGKRVVLDQIRRLGNPSDLLKIAADHFPDVRVLATGWSTLGASAKFRDPWPAARRSCGLPPSARAPSGASRPRTSATGCCAAGCPRSSSSNYLAVLEATFVAHVVRAFTTHSPTEIVSAPKVYGFDTGFVCYYRGWHTLRMEDLGLLWEHYVLSELHVNLQSLAVD